jgi:hypothetical protein
MERDKAKALWDQSRRMVDVMVASECLTPGSYPLWVAQVLFLHCWYAAWNGDNKLLEWALGRRGSLGTVRPSYTSSNDSTLYESKSRSLAVARRTTLVNPRG